MTLEAIKNFFGEKCKVFQEAKTVENKLSSKTKQILHEIGLPDYEGYGGSYIMLDKLELIDNKYLKYGTRKGDEEYYSECIDTETGKIVFNLSYDGNNDYYTLNSDLESYLNYVYVYVKFKLEVKIPQKLGEYHKNHSKYAKELKNQLLKINNDVNEGSWADLIEEMDLGVI